MQWCSIHQTWREICDDLHFVRKSEDHMHFRGDPTPSLSYRKYEEWKRATLENIERDWKMWDREMYESNVTFYSLSSACDAFRMMEERVAESTPRRGDLYG